MWHIDVAEQVYAEYAVFVCISECKIGGAAASRRVFVVASANDARVAAWQLPKTVSITCNAT